MSSIEDPVSHNGGLLEGEMGPHHLLVLVHGMLASPNDWTYFEAELKSQLGWKFLIYASSSNKHTKTFTGIDRAGRRLAEEVKEVVKQNGSLKKISFVSHSLGGLFARYALAILYAQHGTIAGLQPMSFITLATPHLGVRGRNQLPFVFGVVFLEKLFPPIAHILVGHTGRQLFLNDGKSNKPPLLLRMASDCEDGNYISALGSFRCRIVYANTSFDYIVGWRTSSIRRENEVPKKRRQRWLKEYKHVMDVEYCPPVSCEVPKFDQQAEAIAKKVAESAESTFQYHEIMQEEMVHGLQRLGWKKVDVSFHSLAWPFTAHNTLQMKNKWVHSAGAGVVAHVIDSFKHQQESPIYITASL